MARFKNPLFFDIESHSASEMWSLPPSEFFRLGQFAYGREGEVQLTTDYNEMVSRIRDAEVVIGHNIHSFDLSVLFGPDSTEPLEMALEGRVFDTITHASIVNPSPYSFKTREGHTFYDARKPEKAKKWFGLDQQCFTLGLQGKIGDLKALAKKYGGFCHIPLDDPEFLVYAVQDVEAVREYAIRLMSMGGVDFDWSYAWREQKIAAIDAQNTRNGFRVDMRRAQDRVDELQIERDEIMSWLVADYGMPTSGKSPWASAAGKQAILSAFESFGVTPTTVEWPRTPTGAPKLGGGELTTVAEMALESFDHFTEDSAAEFRRVAQGIATLKGQRSLAQLAIESMQPDGKAHPDITRLQISGRTSVTKPGLTVWTARGPGAIEKSYFIASPGRKLVEMDYSTADARIVAAYSGDEEFAKRFADGVDSHELTGRLVFGPELYDSNPKMYRQIAKAFGHAYAYRAGSKTLARNAWQMHAEIRAAYDSEADVLLDAQRFVDAMQKAYRLVTRWQENVTEEGEYGYVTNDWGRKLVVDEGRSFTQAPALLGQSGTREIACDALIRIAEKNLTVITWLVAQVHDALVWDIPEGDLDWAVPFIRENMETEFKPKVGGQLIPFPVDSGEPADDWFKAGH